MRNFHVAGKSPVLSLIDRYLLREVLLGWLGITLVLLLIMVSYRMVGYLAQAANGEIPVNVIFVLLMLKSLWLLAYVMPFSLALGVITGLGRLYRDNEMTVLAACGVGPGRIYPPLLVMAAVIAILLGWMALDVIPEVVAYGERITQRAEQQADVSLLGAGRFNVLRGGQISFYAERLSDDKQRMENIFVYVYDRKNRDKPPQVISADSAYRMTDSGSGDDYLVFVNGYRYEGRPGDIDYRIMKFDQQGVRVELPGKAPPSSKRSAIPTAELLGSTDLEKIIELQWRLSVPLSVIVLVFLAVPLSRLSPRKGRYGGLVVPVLVFIIYFNLMGTAKAWVEQGAIPPVIGIWWVHLLPVALAVVLLNSGRLGCRLKRRS
jgi:lipopolysaccharide export system permease protein